MIYPIESHSFRKFLLKSKKASRTWSWRKFWIKIATRILPGKHDCIISFLEISLIRIWINLFEYLLRRRHLEMELGFRTSFTYEESLKIYRGIMQGILMIRKKPSPYSVSECSFSYVTLLMRFLGENTGLHMRVMKIRIRSPMTFQRQPGTLSYQPLEYRLLLLHAALQAAPTYLQNKPLNLTMCWSCSQTSKCFHCSKCLVVRYCGVTCQRADWDQHRMVCASLKDFVLGSPLGRKLYRCMKKLTFAEPVYFCEVLEYVARQNVSRDVGRLQHKSLADKTILFIQELLEDILKDD